MKCYVVLKGGVYDGHETLGVYLDKEKGIKEVLHLVNEAEQGYWHGLKKELQKEGSRTILCFSDGFDFISLIERDLHE